MISPGELPSQNRDFLGAESGYEPKVEANSLLIRCEVDKFGGNGVGNRN